MKGLRRFRFTVGLGALVLGGALALSTGVTPAAAASGGGTVYVLQGLAGVTADVAVDGASAATAVSAKTVVGPLRLAAGRHVVTLTSKGKEMVSASVDVTSGASLDVLAYWAAESPNMLRITVLRNDLSPVSPGKTRVVLTHAIAGPPADIRVNGKVLFHSVANGESLSMVVPAGTYRVTAVATLTRQTLLPEASLTVKAGTLTRAVAIGAPGTAPDVVVHVLPLADMVAGAPVPSAVHTGDGGQAAGLFGGSAGALAGLPRLPFALLSAAFLALGVSLAAARRRRPVSRHAR
ncbi:MAG TPA: DUF4397 domain-containing protein [Kineosporiaceae bacterium]|nr:DUF4397 domain-containing protein [Kineosporiaceae bacterium]